MYLYVSQCSMYILLVDCMMTCATLRTWQDFSENLLSDLVLGTRQADRPVYEFTSLRRACRPLQSLMPAFACRQHHSGTSRSNSKNGKNSRSNSSRRQQQQATTPTGDSSNRTTAATTTRQQQPISTSHNINHWHHGGSQPRTSGLWQAGGRTCKLQSQKMINLTGHIWHLLVS